MWTIAPSTATSSVCARSSRQPMTISMPSRRSTASVTATGKADAAPVARDSGKQKAPRRRISGLSWQIIFFNAVALAILIAGTLLVQSSRQGLVDERMAGIRQVASIVAGTLAEYATHEKTRSIDIDEAEPLLRQLIAPTNQRARLYDTGGRLQIDTRNLLSRNIVETTDLPPLDFFHRSEAWLLRIYDWLTGVRPLAGTEPYFETGGNGRVYGEVRSALGGEPASARRLDQQNKLVLSVAYPVQRFRTIYGVLMMTTEGGDIDDILREERARLIGIALVALTVMVISSFYLSRAIAAPVRTLAAAADRVRSGRLGRETLPAMSDASRVEAELSREQVHAVDLEHLLEIVIEVYQLVPSRRGVRLLLELAVPSRTMVLGQDERLGQVFRNLIDNAVSFSPDDA